LSENNNFANQRPQQNKDNRDFVRTNESIRARELRVIDENGDMLGVMSLKEALERASDAGLDLVEINPESKPPVCKILNYGKYKYELQKKKQEAKKKQKVSVLKELYIHLAIAEHDYQVKFKQTKNFLAEGFKVKIGVKLRGREMAYSAKGIELLERFYNDLGRELGAKLDVAPKLEGNNVITMLSPLANKVSE
jgi:translation initiation factor IF-3